MTEPEECEVEKKAAKMASKRKKVANEILQTENLYVNRLESIVNLFFDPLITYASNEGKNVISVEEVRTIFGNVKVILGYNVILLSNLTERLKEPSSDYCVGDIFFQMAEFLKTYSEYCKNYPRSLAVIKKYREVPEFEQMYLSLHDKTVLGDTTLKDLLIIPVQRIPRYKMLLEEMVKCTTESHPDFQLLKKALEKIAIIADKNEQSQEKYANVSKIVQIQSEFGKREGNAMKLLQPDRIFISQDIVEFQEGSGPSGKGRKLFLFNDLLLIAKPKDEKDKKKTQLKLIKSMDLSMIENISSSITDSRSSLSFNFQSHSYVLNFDTKQAKDMEQLILSNIDKLKSSNIKNEDKCEKKEKDGKMKFLKKSVSKKSLIETPLQMNKVENPLWMAKMMKQDSFSNGSPRRQSLGAKGFHSDCETEIKKSSSMNSISDDNSAPEEVTRSKSFLAVPN